MAKTPSGIDYQDIIRTIIERNGLRYKSQVNIGSSPKGGRHMVDFTVWRPDDVYMEHIILVSVKVQSSSGTAEEKVPYEVIKLIHAMEQNHHYVRAYLIIGGIGFNRGMLAFAKTHMNDYIRGSEKVTVYTTDELISKGIQFTV